jgi:uncharacterized integral membrane protein
MMTVSVLCCRTRGAAGVYVILVFFIFHVFVHNNQTSHEIKLLSFQIKLVDTILRGHKPYALLDKKDEF